MRLDINDEENLARMRRGELYHAFTPQLVAARKRCARVVSRFNNAGELSRREVAEYWKEYTTTFCPFRDIYMLTITKNNK